jgi:hypothetical protein
MQSIFLYICGNSILMFAHTKSSAVVMVTLEELQTIVAQSILSTEAFKAQIAASQEQADRRAAEAKAEADRRAAEAKAEADRRAVEADRRAAEADRRAAEAKAETDRRAANLERILADSKAQSDKERRELREQIGGLHNKFGTFAEGLLLPSVKKILLDDLGLEQVSERTKRNRKVEGAKTFMEVDAFGYSNGEQNTACIAEIKSHLREDGIEQILRQLRDFPLFFRDHADKRLFGLIAAVDAAQSLQERVWREGLYLVLVQDDAAKLTIPQGFIPKNYGR